MKEVLFAEWNNLHINERFRLVPSERWGQAMVATEDSVYIIGGYDGDYLRDIWKFDFRRFNLIELNISMPLDLRRSNQSAVYYPKDRCIYLFGGSSSRTERFNDVYCFDTMTYDIQKVETKGLAPCRRTYHAACIIENFMIIVAGEGIHNLSDVYILNLDNQTWFNPNINFEDGCQFTPRKFHTVTSICNPKDTKDVKSSKNCRYKFIVFGGCVGDYENLDEMFEFDITEIFKSPYYNPQEREEIKDMSVDRNSRDASMERTDEVYLNCIIQQTVSPSNQIIWVKGSTNSVNNCESVEPKRLVRKFPEIRNRFMNSSNTRTLRRSRDERGRTVLVAQDLNLRNQNSEFPNDSNITETQKCRITCRRVGKNCPKSLARWGHSAAYYKDYIVIFGGRKNELDLNDIIIYNIKTQEWKSCDNK